MCSRVNALKSLKQKTMIVFVCRCHLKEWTKTIQTNGKKQNHYDWNGVFLSYSLLVSYLFFPIRCICINANCAFFPFAPYNFSVNDCCGIHRSLLRLIRLLTEQLLNGLIAIVHWASVNTLATRIIRCNIWYFSSRYSDAKQERAFMIL